MDSDTKISELNVIVTTQNIEQDPLMAKGYQQFQVLNLFLDTLVRKDPEYGIVSGVAKNWEVTEDGSSYTFELSDIATFHTGQRIDSTDVKFSFERHLKEDSPSIIASYLKQCLKSIEILNSKKIRFNLKGPYPPFLDLISMPGFGIVHQSSTPERIIGSGPYEYVPDLESSGPCLRSYEEYTGPKAKFLKICFRIERGSEKTVELLNSGEIQLAMGSPLEVALSQELDDALVAHPTFSMVTTFATLNHNTDYLKSLEMRKKVTKIFEILREDPEILTSFDQPLSTFLPLGIMPKEYYSEVRSESEPQLEDFKGLALRLVFPYGILPQKSEEKIASSLRGYGFEVESKSVKGKDLLDTIQSGAFDILLLPYQGVIPDPDGYLDLLYPDSLLKEASLPTKNLLDQLSQERFSKDREKRLSHYAKVLKEWENQRHIVPFSQNSIPIIAHKSLRLPNLNYSFHLNIRDVLPD